MFLSLALGLSVQAISIDVSPDGPLRSPGEALIQARRQRQGSPNVPVEIRIHDGYYALQEPLKLTAEDSNVRILGTGPGLPRLSGAARLTDWKPVNGTRDAEFFNAAAVSHIYYCDLTAEQASALDDYVPQGFELPDHVQGLELLENGLPLSLARYPKEGSWLRIGTLDSSSEFSVNDPAPFQWKQASDLWTLGYWQFDWAEAYEPVKQLNGGTQRVVLNDPQFGYPPKAGRRFAFLNALAALDGPGQWGFSRDERRLFVWTQTSSPELSATMLDQPLIQISGASDVVVAGLDVEGGRASGITVSGGTRVQVMDCLVRSFGTFGVSMTGSTESRISGCDVTAVGAGGLILSGGDRATLVPGHVTASDNHLWNFGRWHRTYHPGIYLEGVGNLVTHNRIHQAPHQAIMLTGNDHTIEYNDISDVCRETGDAGAIYMGRDPTMRGTVIRYNRLSNLSPLVNTDGNYTGVMGVYLDDCFAGTSVVGNIFDMRGTGVMVGGGRDNTVSNNVFLNCQPAIHFDARGKGWAAKMIDDPKQWDFSGKMRRMKVDQPPYSVVYPALAASLGQDFAFPAGNHFTLNLCFGGKWMDLLDHLTARDFDGAGNVINPTPVTLAQALAAAPGGFQQIPVDQIGVRTKKRPSDRVSLGS